MEARQHLQKQDHPNGRRGDSPLLFPGLLIFVLLSGATALVYEVVWVRMLILRLGSTSLAISTVVTGFMAGLAFGAQAAGRYSSRMTRPLMAYALLELGIALSAVLLPVGLQVIEPLYRVVWQQFHPQFLTFNLLQFAFTFLLLFVPTALMGATLPVLSQACVHHSHQAGRRVGALYGMNTLGAVLGTLLAGFLLLPTLGVTKTLLATAAVNILLALGVWSLERMAGAVETGTEEGDPAEEPPSPQGLKLTGGWVRVAVLTALLVSGFTSMVYQVAWSRTLSLVIGSSVYAFTIILATFLSGIALGSLATSRWIGRFKGSLAWWIVLTQVFIGCAAYATTSLVNSLPYYFTRGYHWLNADPTWVYLLSFALAALIIFPSTFAMGSMFPLVVAFFSRSAQGVGRLVGNLYFVNTTGAILGAFSGGFILLALLGIRTTIVSAISMNLYVAALVSLFIASSLRTRVLACLLPLGLVGMIMAMPPAWNSLLMSSGMYQYANSLESDFSDEDFWNITEGDYQLLFYEEGLTTTISVLYDGQEVLLINNGKIDASSHADIPTQLLLAHFPLLLHPEPRDVCVIGMGSGMTAGSALQYPIRSLVLLELESGVLKASRYFEDVNNRPLSDSRTEAVTADGRNYLTMTSRHFDVIISEPPNPWITGVSNLFTREFFEAARKRLRPKGILGQWLELYTLPPDDLRAILASFTSVFPHVQIFSTIEESDLVVLGSDAPLPLDLPAFQRRMSRPEVARDLARVDIHEVADLISYFKIGEKEIRALAAGSTLNTDDNMRIEFSAPWYLSVDTGRLNKELLDASTAGPVPYLVGLDDPEIGPGFLASLEAAYRERSRLREAELVKKALKQRGSQSELQQR